MQVQAAHSRRRFGSDAGYSLIELLMVVAIVAILGGMVMTISATSRAQSKADSAVSAAVSTLEIARNRAIAERRNVEIHFVPPNRIWLGRQEADESVAVIGDTLLENDMIFKKFTAITKTPEASVTPGTINFDGPTPVMFSSDGSLVDYAGDPTNGTILFGARTSNDTNSARAITLFGTTGLIQAWRWVAGEWTGL